MIKWIKKFFHNEDNSKLKRLNGRASCAVCNKKLEDNIFVVPNDEYFYCKKHARERLHGLVVIHNKKIPSSGSENYYVCKECNRELPVSGKNFEFCSKCRNFYCIEHFDDHQCIQHGRIMINTTNSNECHYCKKELNPLNRFSCKYCGKWFCDEHRLPENHKCNGKVKNPHKDAGVIKYSRRMSDYSTEYN